MKKYKFLLGCVIFCTVFFGAVHGMDVDPENPVVRYNIGTAEAKEGLRQFIVTPRELFTRAKECKGAYQLSDEYCEDYSIEPNIVNADRLMRKLYPDDTQRDSMYFLVYAEGRLSLKQPGKQPGYDCGEPTMFYSPAEQISVDGSFHGSCYGSFCEGKLVSRAELGLDELP